MKSLILLATSLCVLNAGYIKEALNAKDDHNKLAQIYEDACDKEKKASGCYNLAVLYSRGDGNVKKDEAKAAMLYEKACDQNFSMACSNLGYVYEKGKGVEKDLAKAVKLYEKACSDNEGCTELGLLYANGTGVEKDLKRQKSSMKRLVRQVTAWDVATLATYTLRAKASRKTTQKLKQTTRWLAQTKLA